jgi:hypothetical protein
MRLAHVRWTTFDILCSKLEFDEPITDEARWWESVQPIFAAKVRLEIEERIPSCVAALQPALPVIGFADENARVMVVEGGVARAVLE